MESVPPALVVEEEEVSYPIVFQCMKCHLVVGDSFAFHSANSDNQTITLSAASNIKRIPELFTSFNGHDIGSTYINFKCSGCESPLGKYYLTTSSDLDNLREAFTFEVKNVASYELGKARHGKHLPEPIPTSENESENSFLLETGQSLPEALSSINTEIRKIYHVMFDLAGRVDDLETKRMVCNDIGFEDEQQGGDTDDNGELNRSHSPPHSRQKLEHHI